MNMLAHLSVIGIFWNSLRSLGAALYVSPILKVRVAILQNSGIRLYFHAIVRHGRVPPMDAETIGGTSTGLSLYSGLVCVPPFHKMLETPARI